MGARDARSRARVHVQTLTLTSEQWNDSIFALEGLQEPAFPYVTLVFLGFRVLRPIGLGTRRMFLGFRVLRPIGLGTRRVGY